MRENGFAEKKQPFYSNTRCARSKIPLTVNNVHLYCTGIRVARLARVVTGIARHGFLDHQATRCFGTFLRDEADAAARRVEIDNLDKIAAYTGAFSLGGHRVRQYVRVTHSRD